MPRFKVTETCNAVVRTTWVLDARSAAEAEKMARSGDYESEEDEVYGHQSPEYEVEPIEPDPKPKGRN
jgi:hypothetical protein